MEWVATAIAILAAAAAFWQAYEAREARTDARKASVSAAGHESAVLDLLNGLDASGSRTAVATEGIDISSARTADALQRIATSPPPWKLEPLGVEGQWRLVDESTTAVRTNEVTVENPEHLVLLEADGWEPSKPKDWNPGDWERLAYGAANSFAGPGSITIVVSWRWFDDPQDIPDRHWKGIIS
jgi:hypothetical protein